MVGCDFLGADPKILIQNDYKTRFLMEVSCFCSFFFDNFAWICTILAIQNQFFSNEKHTTMFQISAKGWFLWDFRSSKAGVKVESTWRVPVLRVIDPRLVSIKGFDSSKGTDHEMSWHQMWEKLGFSLVKKNTYFWKNMFFVKNGITEEKKLPEIIPTNLWVLVR